MKIEAAITEANATQRRWLSTNRRAPVDRPALMGVEELIGHCATKAPGRSWRSINASASGVRPTLKYRAMKTKSPRGLSGSRATATRRTSSAHNSAYVPLFDGHVADDACAAQSSRGLRLRSPTVSTSGVLRPSTRTAIAANACRFVTQQCAVNSSNIINLGRCRRGAALIGRCKSLTCPSP